MTAPINSSYAIADLAYDGIEGVILAGEQESIARRRRIWRRGEWPWRWFNGALQQSPRPSGKLDQLVGSSWGAFGGDRLPAAAVWWWPPNSLSIIDVLKK